MQRPDEKRKLPVKLSELELLQRGEQLAETVDEITQLEARRAAISKELGDQIKAEREQQIELSKAIETGVEPRKVRCEWTADFSAKEWRLHRTDTGEVIQQDTMTEAELQLSLQVS